MATYDSNSAVFYVFISIKRQNSTTNQNNKSIKHHWNINIFVFPNCFFYFGFFFFEMRGESEGAARLARVVHHFVH